MTDHHSDNLESVLSDIMRRIIEPSYVPPCAVHRFCADSCMVLIEVYLAVKVIGVHSGIAKASLLKTLIELRADLELMANSSDRQRLAEAYGKVDSKDWAKLVCRISEKHNGKKQSADFRPYNSNGRWQGGKTTIERIVDIDQGATAIHVYDLANTMTHINPNGGSIRGAIAQGDGLIPFFHHFALGSLECVKELGFLSDAEAERLKSLP